MSTRGISLGPTLMVHAVDSGGAVPTLDSFCVRTTSGLDSISTGAAMIVKLQLRVATRVYHEMNTRTWRACVALLDAVCGVLIHFCSLQWCRTSRVSAFFAMHESGCTREAAARPSLS